MAISGQSLADGQLPAAPGVLFTATSITYEKTLTLCNVGGTTETVKIYFTRLASANVRRQLREIVLEPQRSYELTIALPMSIGDTIDGETTNALTVDYVLGGGITS
jgi:hypothetical protein